MCMCMFIFCYFSALRKDGEQIRSQIAFNIRLTLERCGSKAGSANLLSTRKDSLRPTTSKLRAKTLLQLFLIHPVCVYKIHESARTRSYTISCLRKHAKRDSSAGLRFRVCMVGLLFTWRKPSTIPWVGSRHASQQASRNVTSTWYDG